MLKIRKADARDLRDLVDLGYGLTEHEFLCDPLIKKRSKKESQKIYLKALKDSRSAFFLASHDGASVGYIYGYIQKAPDYLLKHKYLGQLEAIFVSPKVRRTNVGKKLVKELLKWFAEKKIKLIELSVAVANGNSLKFWENCGFSPHHVHMRKLLKK